MILKRSLLPAVYLSLVTLCSLDTRPNLAPPTTFEVGKFGLVSLHWGEIISGQKLPDQSNFQGGLYTMINSNVINTRVEFVFNKHGCRWRAEMYRFESI